MRQVMVAAACMALAACASSRGELVDTAPAETTTSVETFSEAGTINMRTTRSDPTASFAIEAPPDRVFQALASVYEELGLKVNSLDTQTRRIGVENARVRRQLGGQRMSRYLECGERLGGRVAETDDIMLTIVTQVSATGAASTLRTLVDAQARPIGVSGNPITCATTGAIEARLVERVRAAVAR